MRNDPIVEEIRKIREAHAAKFNYDTNAILADIKKRDKKRKGFGPMVSLHPKRIVKH